MTYAAHPGVDAYIAGLPEWQREICQHLRDLAHAADAEVEESVKRTVQPYFVLQGNVCALLATKDHVNLFLYDGGLAPDPHAIITSGHGNSTGRTISYYQGDVIPTAHCSTSSARSSPTTAPAAGGGSRLRILADGGGRSRGNIGRYRRTCKHGPLCGDKPQNGSYNR